MKSSINIIIKFYLLNSIVYLILRGVLFILFIPGTVKSVRTRYLPQDYEELLYVRDGYYTVKGVLEGCSVFYYPGGKRVFFNLPIAEGLFILSPADYLLLISRLLFQVLCERSSDLCIYISADIC